MASGYAIATLIVFFVSIFFVIRPVSIPALHRLPRIPLDLTTAPILAIAILWAAQCLNPTVIQNGIVGTEGVKPYKILILFFSLSYMAITLDITGVLQAAALWVSNRLRGGYNGWKLYLYFYVIFALFSILLGSDLAIHFGTAFLVYYTDIAKLDPRAWLMAEFAAMNTAGMVFFVGSSANLVICDGFGVNHGAFTAYTILPFLACHFSCFAALAFQYRKQVPRELTHAAHRDPRSALLDPVGAWVGSFMLVTALILCLVLFFFGVDAWMISLPFAAAKLLFDLGWDYYRSSCGIPIALRAPEMETKMLSTSRWHAYMSDVHARLNARFPTFMTALPRLPFALVPFTFSQFILIEALDHHGWVDNFATWLVRASHNQMYPTIWLTGVLGVVLCNILGTNIGATILLTKVVRAAALPYDANRASAIALAVASNIGAVSFTFSASLAGLLWRSILGRKDIHVRQRDFAIWNVVPLLVMTAVGLGIVSAEMAVLFRSSSAHTVPGTYAHVTAEVESFPCI